MKKTVKDIYDCQLRHSRKIVSGCLSKPSKSVCAYIADLFFIADYAERIYCTTDGLLCYTGEGIKDTSTNDGEYAVNLIHLKDELLNLSKADSTIYYLHTISSCSIPQEIFIKDTLLYKCLAKYMYDDKIEEAISYLRELENNDKLSELSLFLSGALETIECFEDYSNELSMLFNKQ